MEEAYIEFRRAYANAWNEMQHTMSVLGRYRDLYRPKEHEPTTESLKRCTKLLDAFTRDMEDVGQDD